MNGKWKLWMSAPLVALVAFACIPEGDSDHDAVQQAVSASTSEAVASVIDGLALMESSEMFGDYAGVQEDCIASGPGNDNYGGVPENGDDYDYDDEYNGYEYEESCSSSAPNSGELDEASEMLEEILETRIFTSANIESESGGMVTYLLKGSVVCDAEDFYAPEEYQGCVDTVEAMEVRLQAQFDADGVLSLDVLLGPAQIHPLTLYFSEDQLSARTVLDNFPAAADHIADVTGAEPLEFPERFEGEVEFGYFADGDDAKLAFLIHEELGIEFEDYELDVEGVGEVFALGFNAVEETLTASVGLGELSFRGMIDGGGEEPMPIDPNTDPDDYPEPVQSEPFELAVDMAGLTSTVVFDPSAERVDFNDVGLGNGPLAISVDGEEVINIDLSAGASGMFDAVLQLEDAGVEYSVDSGFELTVGTYFHRVAESFDDFDDWMLDEVLTIALGGDANPALLIGDGGVEVLRGYLDFSSESTDAGAYVEAGMCLIDTYDDTNFEESEHPFEYLDAGVCEE